VIKSNKFIRRRIYIGMFFFAAHDLLFTTFKTSRRDSDGVALKFMFRFTRNFIISGKLVFSGILDAVSAYLCPDIR